jgi:microcystin-dependent protein
MTAIDFPDEPEVNDSFTAGGRTWTWDGNVWNSTAQPVSLHAGTHNIGGGDELSGLAISQISGLSSALAAAEPPTGTVAMWITTTAPSGWLICDGSPVSRSTFSGLFDIIGTSFGVGDGSTTFNLPNLRGRTAVGLDVSQTEFDSVGKTGGNKAVTLTVAQMPVHNHTQNAHTHTQNSHSHNANTGSNGGHGHSIGGGATTTGSESSHSHQSYPSGVLLSAYTSSNNRAAGTLATVNAASFNGSARTSGAGSSHSHSVPNHGHTCSVEPDHTHSVSVGSSTASNNSTTAENNNAGSGQSHENLQPYLVLEYIIKAI